MLFYLCNIPKLLTEIDNMHNVVLERCKCYSSKAVEYDICEDSDALGHFIMCLVASKSPSLFQTISRGETRLFNDKLTKQNENEIINEMNNAVKFINCLDEMEDTSPLNSRLEKCRNLIKNTLKVITFKSKHLFFDEHRRECCKYEIVLPFTFPLRLVARREIEIVGGKAKIPCGLWSNLLTVIFEMIFEFEVEFFKKFNLLQFIIYKSEDDRLRNVIEVTVERMTGLKFANEKISGNDIDKCLKYYPPCMSNLHKILRESHRLSYMSRYQYTLFLKDIGLPAQENVSFWENEYSKPYCASSCVHNWQENETRYKYQILHLYGLNGAGILKTSHSCEKFIEKLTLRMDGGCPFVHFDKEALTKSFLEEFKKSDIEDIIHEKEMCRPQRACALYLSRRTGNSRKPIISEILSPLQYYNQAKGMSLSHDETV